MEIDIFNIISLFQTSYFELILDFKKTYKNSTGSSIISLTPVSPNVSISHKIVQLLGLLLLLLRHFSCVRLCVTPETAAHQSPLSLGFSRQEHWSGLPFPSPVIRVRKLIFLQTKQQSLFKFYQFSY